MARIEIEFDKEICIGCGACEAVCPENWVLLTDEGKAKPKKIEVSEIGNNKEAEEICPVNAIKLKTKD